MLISHTQNRDFIATKNSKNPWNAKKNLDGLWQQIDWHTVAIHLYNQIQVIVPVARNASLFLSHHVGEMN